jgi:hypothetical protein
LATAGGRQTVQDGCLGVFEIQERQNRLGGLFLPDFDLDIGNGLRRRWRQLHRMALCGVDRY